MAMVTALLFVIVIAVLLSLLMVCLYKKCKCSKLIPVYRRQCTQLQHNYYCQ